MKIRIRFDKNQVKKFSGISNFKRMIKTEMKSAIKEAAKVGQLQMKEAIRSGKARPKPSRFTQEVKGSGIPLLDTGKLMGGIRVRVKSWKQAEIGFSAKSKQLHKARTLELGGRIPVTNAMRGMFLALFRASQDSRYVTNLRGRARILWTKRPGGWLPLASTKTHIKVRARPFLRFAFKNRGARKEATGILFAAYDRAFHKMG